MISLDEALRRRTLLFITEDTDTDTEADMPPVEDASPSKKEVFLAKLKTALEPLWELKDLDDPFAIDWFAKNPMKGYRYSYNVKDATSDLMVALWKKEIQAGNTDVNLAQPNMIGWVDNLLSMLREYADPPLTFASDLTEFIKDGVKTVKDMYVSEIELRTGAKYAPFGNFVFAPARRGEVKWEPNTSEENFAYDSLKDHVNNNEPLDDEAALILAQALEDQSYPSILHEPNAEWVFRGINMHKEKLQELLGRDDIAGEHSMKFDRRVGGSPSRSKQGSSSWTTDWDVARQRFARASWPRCAVIFAARVSDNPDTFLEGPNGFYKVKELAGYTDEVESAALGSVKTHSVYWYCPESVTDYTVCRPTSEILKPFKGDNLEEGRRARPILRGSRPRRR